MRYVVSCCAIGVVSSLALPASFAQDLQPLEPTVLEQFVEVLLPPADKIEQPILKITADVSQANGVRHDMTGLIVIPHKGFKLDDPAAESKLGTPVGHLFMTKGFFPVVDDKPVDPSRLRYLKIAGPDGNPRETTHFALAIAHTKDDVWHLYAFGIDDKPVLDLAFDDEPLDTTLPLALEVKDFRDNRGTVHIYVLSDNRATFPITFTPPPTP